MKRVFPVLLLLPMLLLSACSFPARRGPVPHDGQWLAVDPDIDFELRTLAAGGGRWVAGGTDGMLIYSHGGHDWFKASLGERQVIQHLLSDGWDFRAFTDSSDVYRSKDEGENWELEGKHVMATFRSLAYHSGKYVGLSGRQLGRTMDPSDRWSWFSQPFAAYADQVAVTPDGFGVVVAHDSTIHNSWEGTIWEEHKVDLPEGVLPATLSGGKIKDSKFYFLTSTRSGQPGPLFRSVDGLNWSEQPVADDFAVTRVFDADDLFIAVSSLQPDRVYASWDGQNWVRQDLPEPVEIIAVATNLDKVAALGKNGQLLIYEGNAK